MKISERKQRLRARGVVPVSQEMEPRKKTVSASSPRARSAPVGKGTAPTKAPRPRWQPSPGYQLAFGVAYIIFAPILFFQNFVAMRTPHTKYHPGAFEFIMPIVFFLFGVWWVYRGLVARRRKNALTAASRSAASKTELVKGSSR
jgi:hypothetical protein